MKEKKNIDNIFNEAFKNFEATPSPRVWENIQTQLKKEKKERKVIPLWVKLGGVAALLALLLTVGNSIYNSPNNIVAPEITNENVKQIEKQLHENKSDVEINNQKINTQVASENETHQNNTNQNSDSSEVNSLNNKVESKSSNKSSNNTPEKIPNSIIASENSKNHPLEENSQKTLIETNISKNDTKEAIATSEKLNSEKKNDGIKESVIDNDNAIFDAKKESIALNTKSEKKNFEPISKEKKETTEIAPEKDSQNKKSIFDAIAEKDDIAKIEKTKKEKPEYRWNVAPNVAPVYYSSFGNGSSIDPTFADNPQKGDVNMSYGVQVSYSLSNRLSIRSGVNNVDLSYSTSDIIVGTSPVATALRSINYGTNTTVITAVDRDAYNNSNNSGGYDNLMPKSTQGEALLIQNINYYEVPVELKYSILDRKLGLNLIGGLSTMFLGNNEISVKADNFNTILGEANNLSSVSFSTNVGLGLDYKLSKKFTFNIEPMFKYQLNPYTDSSVSFKPYYLGVYSGLNFKF